ncbi:MAG: family peptidase, partial [Myxococcaceae bacterium]|nr:family peptidase [Myxococcaceae bacterium]
MNPLLETPVALLIGLSVFGAPSVTWLERDVGAPSPRVRGQSAESAARAHLAAEAHRFGISPALLSTTPLEQLHDVGAGAVVVSFRAQLGEVPVFLHRLSVVMDRDYRAVAMFGGLPAIAFQPTRLDFLLSDRDALSLALPGAAWLSLPPRDGDRWWSSAAARGRTRQVAFALPDRLEPAWYVELEGAEAFALVISARDGALLFRQSLDHDSSYRVWADPAGLHQPYDGPQGGAPSPHPTGKPDGWQATWTAPSLVTLDHGPISTLDPWLPAGATECTGNNVDAYADLVAPDGFGAGDVRAVADGGVFGASYDLGAAPGSSSQQQAGTTQLFYTLNFLHDWFYDVGFTEAAGNAQADNKGRGGRGGDRLLAESQDHAVRNNAFMRTPADGSSPKLSIGVYD